LIGVTQGNVVVDPNLRPERVKTMEAGFELSLMKNRFSLEGSVFKQKADLQILDVTTSFSTGFNILRLNAAALHNYGIEGDFRGNVYKNKDWNINLTANYTWSKNKVKELYGNTGLNSYIYQSGSTVILSAVLNQMFPYMKATAYERDDAGHVVIDPSDGWPVRASNFKGMGTTLPMHILGVGINVAYKSLTLVADAEYRGGNVMYSSIGADMNFTGSGAQTVLYNRDQFVWPNSVYWDGSKYVENTNIAVANYKAIYQGTGDYGFTRGFLGVGEMLVSSAAFWKLRDVSLSYDLPKSVMNHIKFMRGISITAWGRNLVVLRPDDNCGLILSFPIQMVFRRVSTLR